MAVEEDEEEEEEEDDDDDDDDDEAVEDLNVSDNVRVIAVELLDVLRRVLHASHFMSSGLFIKVHKLHDHSLKEISEFDLVNVIIG